MRYNYNRRVLLSDYKKNKTLELIRLFVHPEYQNKGYGSKALRFLKTVPNI
ncbi:MAG: GNAT family N-acetyltransferase [Spirochaetales bacterium]|nr:GNAT family N-acetyltransferase [Spirochaetales bacterium]